jgi:hypothetical protein
MRAVTDSAPAGNWVAVLQCFAVPPLADRCELCGRPIAADHVHLVETERQRLLCVCGNCGQGVSPAYRRVPRQVRRLDEFRMTDGLWEALQIPIGVAFFYYSGDAGRVVARYPGAAGAAESLLDLNAWAPLAAANPVLHELEPEVEALLVNRLDGAREYYRVPIDRCYLLTALIRRHWRGFSGGSEARSAMTEFFDWLRGEPQDLGVWNHA